MARVFIARTMQSARVHVSHILNIQFCVFQCCQKAVSREPYCLTSHQVFISEPPPQSGGASSLVRSQPDICLNYRRQVPQRWEDMMAGVSRRTRVPGFQYARNVPGYLVPPVTPHTASSVLVIGSQMMSLYEDYFSPTKSVSHSPAI